MRSELMVPALARRSVLGGITAAVLPGPLRGPPVPVDPGRNGHPLHPLAALPLASLDRVDLPGEGVQASAVADLGEERELSIGEIGGQGLLDEADLLGGPLRLSREC